MTSDDDSRLHHLHELAADQGLIVQKSSQRRDTDPDEQLYQLNRKENPFELVAGERGMRLGDLDDWLNDRGDARLAHTRQR